MKKIVLGLALVLGVCILIGCHPKRIVWSSDGKWAAVTGTGSLYFCDSNGKITERIKDGILRAQWFPNEYRLATERGIRANNWQLMEANVPEAERQKLIQHAKSLSDVNDALEWKIKTDTLVDTKVLSKNEIKGVILYLRDKSPNKHPQTVVDSWPKDINFDYYFLEIGLWKDGKFTTEKTLWSSDERVWDIRISSKGRVIAFTSVYSDSDEDDGSNYSTLWVADCDTGRVVLIDKNVALYPDWSNDGKSLFYVRSISETDSENVIGTLMKNQICDDSGALLNKTKSTIGPEALAGLIINAYTKVRCLSDGRIVFSSIEVSLPTIGADVPRQKQLFTLDPKRQVTITRLIPRSTLDRAEDYNIDFFEVSPDETMISIPSDEGRVAVFYPLTGEFKVLQAEKIEHLKTVPVWRYPNDLCYVNANDEKEAEHSEDVVLQTPTEGKEWSEPRSISKSWSSEAKDGWLE